MPRTASRMTFSMLITEPMGFLADLRDGDFTADDDDVALHEGFAGHAALRIDREAGVEDGVGNGVGNFVRMAFADGFGGKNVGAHVLFNFRIVKS